MLAWLVSIDIVEMNHRHKPKKKKAIPKDSKQSTWRRP